jgi:cellulose biosynthesis protein BcsQ
MAFKTVLFNHKGGVSKTTTSYNLGWMLASKGYRVLLVDADPQCNLSGLVLGDVFESYYFDDVTKNQKIKILKMAWLLPFKESQNLLKL